LLLAYLKKFLKSMHSIPLVHEQGQAFGVCLANEFSKPVWFALGGAEEVVVLYAKSCQSLHTDSLKFKLQWV